MEKEVFSSQPFRFLTQLLLKSPVKETVMSSMGKSFGENLKLLMQQKNLSASRLAKDIGVSPKTLLEWTEKGGRMPRSPDHIRALADYFHISTHQLLFGEDDPRSPLSEFLDKTEIHTGTYELTIKRVNIKSRKL